MPRDHRMRVESADAEAKDEVSLAVQRLNERHAVILIGNEPAVLEEMQNAEGEPDIRILSIRGFKEWQRTTRVMVGQRYVTIAEAWLNDSRRRTFEGLTFAPGRATPRWYNLWRGYTVEPDPDPEPETRCARFLNHVAENICEGDEKLFAWVMGWFAQMIQQPANKLGTALVLQGGQGTGKTFVGQTVGSLLGDHYRLIGGDVQRITGRFNSHLARLLLLQLDEVTWGGDHQAAGRLKDLVTGHETLIEYKGKEPVRVRNYLRLLITSNNHWVIPAGLEERRFAVLRVGDGKRQDGAYFNTLLRELAEGGKEALLAYLLAYDLRDINLRQVPTTAALFDQQIASLPSTAQWWLDVLQRGVLPGDKAGIGEAPRAAVYADYIEHAKTVGISRRAIETEIGLYLKRAAPGVTEGRALIPRAGGEAARPRTYVLPTLAQCRRAFAESLGSHASAVEWEEPDARWSADTEVHQR